MSVFAGVGGAVRALTENGGVVRFEYDGSVANSFDLGFIPKLIISPAGNKLTGFCPIQGNCVREYANSFFNLTTYYTIEGTRFTLEREGRDDYLPLDKKGTIIAFK